MLKNIFSATALLVAVTLLVSCGTIIQGTSQQVSVSSNPSNAEVTVDGQQLGRTPVVLDLKRKDKHTIRIALDGYQPYEAAIARKVSGWIVGNILFGGLIGLAVDAITGGMYKLTPEQITAEMRENGSSAAVLHDGEIFITVVLEPDSSWQKIGELERLGK